MSAYDEAEKKYKEWLSNEYFDDETHAELESIEGNKDEILDRFYTTLKFGTAGLRGVIGAGTNRMNKYIVRQATQGLANYIISLGAQDMGVAIAFDSRHMSTEFAEEAGLCLAANGIRAYVFESLRPTPELSFAVRYLGCTAGINVTASHNPPEYNGYKVYWADGAQITPPHDVGIMAEVGKVTDFGQVKTMDKEAAMAADLFRYIGAEVDDAYMAELKKVIKCPEAIAAEGANITVIYTPLHGTGNIPARRILREIGFTDVTVVPEQELPDGDFPTVSYPNPEDPAVYKLALKLAHEKDADLVLATDPDADRLGVYVKDKAGEYHSLTGNMSGCLLADYELGRLADKGAIPADGKIVTTIVSSCMAAAIAKYYGVEIIEVLTGFKYIGEQILLMEKTGVGHYLYGFEESYGNLIGTYARDKDAISATMALCEAAAYYKTKDMTLWDALIELYERVGYYLEGVSSVEMKGFDGKEKMDALMKSLRETTPEMLGDYKVLAKRDYKTRKRLDCETGETTDLTLPVSDVIYYELPEDAWCCVRPSGTEPKVKFYYGVKGTSFEDAQAKDAMLKAAIGKLAE